MKNHFLIISIGLLTCLLSCNKEESSDITTKENEITVNHNSFTLSNFVKEQKYRFTEVQNLKIGNKQILDCLFESDKTLIQKALEANYSAYSDNSNSHNGQILRGKPYTIIKSKGQKLYRWNCKEGDQHGWTNTRSEARTSAKSACNQGYIIQEVDIKIQAISSINQLTKEHNYNFLETQKLEVTNDRPSDCLFGSEGTAMDIEVQIALEKSYFTYFENSNSSGGETILGKPFTITRTGTNWYRWNCKSDKSIQGWSNSRAHARKKAKAACGSGNMIIEEVGIQVQVIGSINELTKL